MVKMTLFLDPGVKNNTFTESFLNISCIFSIHASILFLRLWIIFTIITLNSFSGVSYELSLDKSQEPGLGSKAGCFLHEEQEISVGSQWVNILVAHMGIQRRPFMTSVLVSKQRTMKRCMVRRIYCEILGCTSSFGCMNTINLTQEKFLEKRIGICVCSPMLLYSLSLC
ncbi:uncharacterized protein [Tursiops truncatus]|uniref:uncharacterized protein isoform X1 n=1 Tax=Tursiops truncatus TaxID=9739 RepID=UPI003CCF6344